MKQILILLMAVFLWSCVDSKTETSSAEAIVDRAIAVAGGHIVDTSTIAFSFRDKRYKAMRNQGQFKLERTFKDSVTTVRDVLSNEGFKRFLDSKEMIVADSMIPRYSASVNSVHYFSVLPYGLNDAAVNLKLLPDTTIDNDVFYSIQVTFSEEGGGEDFEDVFMYWIDKETYKVAYLAYSYNEADGQGLRFRKAKNERNIKGIRFVDYDNYKPKDPRGGLTELPQLFSNNKLELLSNIALEDIQVSFN
ncbi:MAG: deoxyribose-phosphate aldolase [Algicola sp.]|nr:deoxyribose-phosphate aldolase [Algicola sp.]